MSIRLVSAIAARRQLLNPKIVRSPVWALVARKTYATAAPLGTTHSQSPAATPSLRRFWKKVDVKEVEGGYYVTLDGRNMKTPEGRPLLIPKEKRLLALLIAGEWESQDTLLKSYSLPLTSVVVRSIDAFHDPETRKGVIDTLLRYLNGDSTCYYQDYPDSFVRMQETHWRPLITWMSTHHNINLQTTSGMTSVKQSEEVVAQLRQLIESFDNLTLAAFEKAVLTAKSFVIGLALTQRRITVEEGAIAGRLEVLHQIDRWGEVEDSHDLDREEMKRQLGSVTCVLLKQ